MTREQLLILVMVAFILLINFATRVLRRGVKGGAPRHHPHDDRRPLPRSGAPSPPRVSPG